MVASLRVLLRSYFPTLPIKQIEYEEDLAPRLATSAPLLVLIDANLPEQAAWRIGAEIRDGFPRHHPVILTHIACQVEQSREAGLDALPLEGLTANSLLDVLRVFLPV